MKLIKKYINKLFIRLLIFFNNRVDIDFQSNLSLKITRQLKGTNLYKVIIKNSILSGDICVGEGCRLNGTILSGKVYLDRFVSINGPGTRLSSMVNEIKIGSFTSIASNVIIQEYSHIYERISTYYMNQNIFNKDRSLEHFFKRSNNYRRRCVDRVKCCNFARYYNWEREYNRCRKYCNKRCTSLFYRRRESSKNNKV